MGIDRHPLPLHKQNFLSFFHNKFCYQTAEIVKEKLTLSSYASSKKSQIYNLSRQIFCVFLGEFGAK